MRALLLALACFPYGATSIRIAETDDIVTNQLDLADTDRSDSASTAVVPHDYFTAGNAALRCKQARRGRNVRRLIGVVTGLLFAVPAAAIGFLATSAAYWTWYLNGQTAVMFVSTVGAGALSAWASIASAQGGVRVGMWTTDVFARLFGADGHKPSCCCFTPAPAPPAPAPPVDNATEGQGPETVPPAGQQCALIGTSIGRKAACPEGAVHDAGACDTPELLEYASDTVGKCECKEAKTCETNKFHRGHAWCIVKSGRGCSPQARTWHFKHWDYCKGTSSILPNSTSVVNEALAKFAINQDKGRFRADPRSVWRLGSWVDTSKALVVARVKVENKMFKQSSCFAGDEKETLDTCAAACVDDGAVVAETNVKMKCVAFAYNRKNRLCVRLPEEATGAEFKPFQRNPRLSGGDREGWQNFKRVVD